MRYKNFQAKTLAAARAQVRQDLGDDALIAATHDLGEEGYRIVCALEPKGGQQAEQPQEKQREQPQAKQLQAKRRNPMPPRQAADLARALAWHQLPFEITEEILDLAADQRHRSDNEEALASALERVLRFQPLQTLWQNQQQRRFLFFGPPGSGKTATCVKTAWIARSGGDQPTLISTDSLRTGGAEQLEMYAEKIACQFFHCRSSQRFQKLMQDKSSRNLLFIDAPGINPYAKEERAIIHSLTQHASIVPVLVMPTWIDIQAGIDLVNAFPVHNCKHLVITGEDIDRRLGRAIAIARYAALNIAYVSPRPHIAQGLEPLSARSLAERCLKDIPQSFLQAQRLKAQKSVLHSTDDSQSDSPRNSQSALSRAKASLAPRSAVPAQSSRSASVSHQALSPRKTYQIAVASGKGGVGKTAIAITLAHCLAELGRKTLLFDADLGLANIDIQLGVMPQHHLAEAIRGHCRLKDCIVRAPQGAFDTIVGKSGSASFADLAPQSLQKLVEDLQEVALDYQTLIIDLGAGIDRTVRWLTIASDETLLVVNDEPTSLTDAYALVKIILRRQPDARLSVVVNMAETERRGEQAFESLQRTCRNFLNYDLRLKGIVRRDMNLVEAIRNREPLLTFAPHAPAALDLAKLARTFPHQANDNA